TLFLTREGYHFETHGDNQHWSQSLHNKLLILDVDIRLGTDPGALPNETSLKNETMGRTAGMTNHYLYIVIHGYDYRFIRAPGYPYRHEAWTKVPMIREALKDHEIVVFLNADVIFMYPQMPFEWIMKLWNVTNNTLIFMTNDLDPPRNRHVDDQVTQNSRFLIARQSNGTQGLLNDWENCHIDRKSKKCKPSATGSADERAALSSYVWYNYSSTGIGGKACGGDFIRNHWLHEGYPAKGLSDLVMKLGMPTIDCLAISYYVSRQSLASLFNVCHPYNIYTAL
ncbi:uncharacterized protein B0J16DRAFT_276707, partial [Fusarium flagelliforme]|uniref:uncharacterized protein n=1 Tax=Fusarium flagelliforme TaxID=2675880 RepID=UPI001E8E3615